MTEKRRKAAITGASGYLGSLLSSRLGAAGYEIIRYVRTADGDDQRSRPFVLGDPIAPEGLDEIDLLVHCAYDMRLVDEREIWRVNVEGARRLLEAASQVGVRRIIVISSMSAYEGTTQIYGRAKLAIEAATTDAGGVSVRPGLTWGARPGGMVGALRKLTRLPIVPVVGGDSKQYLVHESDLADAVVALAEAPTPPLEPLGAAHPEPLAFRRALECFARDEHRSPTFIPIPWQTLSLPLRVAERLGVSLPFRSDSLLGLIRPAPTIPGVAQLAALGVTFRALQ